MTGFIRMTLQPQRETCPVAKPHPPKHDDLIPLSQKDIYKELRLRGYYYSGLFRGVESCDTTASIGQLQWKNNYVSFMDTMLQMQILQVDTRGLFVPTAVEKVVIDIHKHRDILEGLREGETIPVYVHKDIKRIE